MRNRRVSTPSGRWTGWKTLLIQPMRWGRQAFPAGGRRGTGLVGGTMAHA